LIGKRMGLLTEALPKASVLAFLVDPNNPISDPDAKEARIAAKALGRELVVISAMGDFEVAFAAMALHKVGALLVSSAPFFVERREQIIALAARHEIPALYDQRMFPVAGGLMSYSTIQDDSWRQGGAYIGRILKGEKPGDLPVQQSTKVEFVVNLKTAKMLGLTIPPTVLALADEVIE
jgi:putative ABC transport system substrate-binding protein